MDVGTKFETFENLNNLIEKHRKEKVHYKQYVIDSVSYTLLLGDINKLIKENQKYKEIIDKLSSCIKLLGKYDGQSCTRGFSMMTADFNKLLDILKEVE